MLVCSSLVNFKYKNKENRHSGNCYIILPSYLLGYFSPCTFLKPTRPARFATLGFPQNWLLFIPTHKRSCEFGSGNCVSHLRNPLLSWVTRITNYNPVQLQWIYICLFTCGADWCHLCGLLFTGVFGHKKTQIGDRTILSSTHTQKNPRKKPTFPKGLSYAFCF